MASAPMTRGRPGCEAGSAGNPVVMRCRTPRGDSDEPVAGGGAVSGRSRSPPPASRHGSGPVLPSREPPASDGWLLIDAGQRVRAPHVRCGAARRPDSLRPCWYPGSLRTWCAWDPGGPHACLTHLHTGRSGSQAQRGVLQAYLFTSPRLLIAGSRPARGDRRGTPVTLETGDTCRRSIGSFP